MFYTLFNKKLNRKLIHPSIGLWYTKDFEEAEKMLEACKEYLKAIKAENIIEDFIIIEVDEKLN